MAAVFQIDSTENTQTNSLNAVSCSSCVQGEKDALCLICNKAFCRECFCSHYHSKREPGTCPTELAPDKFQEKNSLLDKLQTNEYCPLHKKLITLFCKSDKCFCCDLCISKNHKKCSTITLNDIIESYSSDLLVQDIQKLEKIMTTLDNINVNEQTILKANQEELEKRMTKVKYYIGTTKKEMKKNNLESEDDLCKQYREITTIYNERKLALIKLQEKITGCLKFLQEINKFSPTQICLTIHHFLLSTTNEVNANTILFEKKISKFEFKYLAPDEDTVNLNVLNSKHNDSVVDILKKCRNLLDTLYKLEQVCQGGAGQLLCTSLFQCKLSFVRSVERSKISADCFICFGGHLPDNSILLSDSSKKQLIKLDENLCLLEMLPVQGTPGGFCLDNDGKHLFVICNGNEIVSYTLHGKWKKVRMFGTKHKAWGVACHGDKIITGESNRIVFRDKKGKQISKIITSQEHYNYPVLSQDGKLLYHGDGDDVVCKKMEDYTKEMWRYSSSQLKHVRGIDTDNDGNILVVGWASENMHQIFNNGTNGRVIINSFKTIKNPHGLFYNRTKNTVCVTSCVSSSDCKVSVEMYVFENDDNNMQMESLDT